MKVKELSSEPLKDIVCYQWQVFQTQYLQEANASAWDPVTGVLQRH